VRRIDRLLSSQLVVTTVLVFALTAAGRASVASSLRLGSKLMHQGLFAEAVAAYTRALQQDPSNAKVYYYRALANEMVNRQAAIADWRRFAKSAITDSRLQEAVAQVQQRVQALEKMTELPGLLHPSKYVSKAGDYYPQVAEASLGRLGDTRRRPLDSGRQVGSFRDRLRALTSHIDQIQFQFGERVLGLGWCDKVSSHERVCGGPIVLLLFFHEEVKVCIKLRKGFKLDGRLGGGLPLERVGADAQHFRDQAAAFLRAQIHAQGHAAAVSKEVRGLLASGVNGIDAAHNPRRAIAILFG